MTTPTPPTTEMNLLIIDSQIPYLDAFISSINGFTKYVIFHFSTDTYDSLITAIANISPLPLSYSHIGIVQQRKSGINYQLLKNEPINVVSGVESKDPEIQTWSKFLTFLRSLKMAYQITNVDFFMCNIFADNNWKYIIPKIAQQTELQIGASSDVTGNKKYGGNNWTEESNAVNLKTTYFTDTILDYKGVFDTVFSYMLFYSTTEKIYGCGYNFNQNQIGLNQTDYQYYQDNEVLVLQPVLGTLSVDLCNSHKIIQMMKVDDDFGGTYVLAEDRTTKNRYVYGWGSLYPFNGVFYTIDTIQKQTFPNDTTKILQMSCNADTFFFLYEISPGNRAIYCGGTNANGQFGDGTTDGSWDGQFHEPLLTGNIIQMVSGNQSTLVIYEIEPGDRVIGGWGGNNWGELGIGTTITSPVPVPVMSGDVSGDIFRGNITQIDMGLTQAVAVMNIGDNTSVIYTWGSGSMGDGINTSGLLPIQVLDPSGIAPFQANIIMARVGNWCVLILVEIAPNVRQIYSWGKCDYGQLGNGTSTNDPTSYLPGLVLDPTGTAPFQGNIIEIFCGSYCSYALFADGRVYAWGYNGSGKLGINSSDVNGGVNLPVQLDCPPIRSFLDSPFITPLSVPSIPPTRFLLSSSYTNNAAVYYKPGSLASCGVGSTRNSRHKSKYT
jgi:alpha-tubulin suppressor-like RCC1 family protein